MFGNDTQNQQAADAVTFTQPVEAADDTNTTGSSFTMTPVTSDPVYSEPATAPSAVANVPGNDELMTIKQEALQQLTPLVQHLDQSAEEKFKTIMMMIQATDDHTKLKDAFDAAKDITDDKDRAQALLDVINEINYFTQQHTSEK